MKTTEEKIKEQVRERYTAAVTGNRSCCGTTIPPERIAASAGYRPEELRVIPADAVANSFGCGNPLALADVRTGQVVVDIGSGAGIDCFLAAEKVGAEGKVIGIDMTPTMIEKARSNAAKGNLKNVEFRLGEAEKMPVETGTADWIVSNCVINLSPDKPAVFREAFRVLRPGGKVSISDIMVESLPAVLRYSSALRCACVSGAIPEATYLQGLRDAGFTDVRVTDRLIYDRDEIKSLIQESSFVQWMTKLPDSWLEKILDRYIVGNIWSARVVATKPEIA